MNYDKNKDDFDVAMTRRRLASSATQEQRTQSVEDLKFALVEESQWDETMADARSGRPKYEVNRIIGGIRQVMGDMRQNQISIKVRPRSGGATSEMAEILNGLIRDIENESNFAYAKNVAAKEAFTGGFGAWQVITEEKDPEDFSGEQNIKIKAIHSASTCVYFDPSSTDEMHRDAMFWFVDEEISRDDAKEEFGDDANLTSVSGSDASLWLTTNKDWQDRETVKISNYWCKKPYKKRIAKFSDGSVKEITEKVESVLDEMAEVGITIVEEREVDSHYLEHRKMSGGGFLTEPARWAGSKVNVIPVYGYQTRIDGQHYYSGMVRFAKDAQRIYNYVTSAKIEQTAVSVNNRTMVTPRMIKGHEQSAASTDPQELWVINPDPSVPGGLPLRGSSTPVNSALIEQAYQADQDIQRTLGVYEQSLGSNPREQSGKALMAQQSRMDLGTYELMDSLSRSVACTGEVLIDLIPKIYDTERQERILSDEGEAKTITINQTILDDETGKFVVVENDIGMGRYDVISDIGPSYQTRRAEVKEQMTFLIQALGDPMISKMALPVILENTDSPAANKMGEAISMQLVREGLMPPNEKQQQMLQQEAQAKQQQGPSPEEQMIQMEIQLKAIELKKAEAEARLTAAESMLAEMKIPSQERQEFLENVKLRSEVDKNNAQAEKLRHDAKEPFTKDRDPQTGKQD